MKIVDLQQGTDAWLEWRRGGVTASEAAVALGRDPYMTRWRLWAEKTGKVPREEHPGNPLLRRGKSKEDLCRRVAEERLGGEPLLPVCGESDEHPRIRASFDGLTANGLTPVECKCPHPTTMLEIVQHGKAAKAYTRYWTQVQHQMYVAGPQSRSAILAFYCDELESIPAEIAPRATTEDGVHYVYLEFQVRRDDRFIDDELVPGLLGFLNMVDGKQEPPKDPERDVFVPEGEAFLKWKEIAAEWAARARLISAIKGQLKELTDRNEADQKVLVSIMDGFMQAEACGIRVTRFMKDGGPDYRELIRRHPELEKELEHLRKPPSEQVRVSFSDQTSEKENKARVAAYIEAASAVEDKSVFNW